MSIVKLIDDIHYRRYWLYCRNNKYEMHTYPNTRNAYSQHIESSMEQKVLGVCSFYEIDEPWFKYKKNVIRRALDIKKNSLMNIRVRRTSFELIWYLETNKAFNFLVRHRVTNDLYFKIVLCSQSEKNSLCTLIIFILQIYFFSFLQLSCRM